MEPGLSDQFVEAHRVGWDLKGEGRMVVGGRGDRHGEGGNE